MSEKGKLFFIEISNKEIQKGTGLFDTILIKTKCPKCGAEDEDLQTKALDPILRTFRPGDALPDDFTLFGINDGWIEGHTYCLSCNTRNSYKVKVKNNRITGDVELLEQW